MLKFRKILLCDCLYYLIFLITILYLFAYHLVPRNSIYSEDSNFFSGKIQKIIKEEDKTTLYIKKKETLMVSFYKEIKVSLGDYVIGEGSFEKPESKKDKYLFDYQKYLKRKNIFYLVKGSYLQVIKKNKNPFYYLKEQFINSLKKDPYLYTFILGDKTYLKEEVKRSFSENGISHLFAISGMHITLLVEILKKGLKKLHLREENRFKISIIFLFKYLLLVGFSSSIVRGVLFYFFFSMNNIYYFHIKKENIILLIISISLWINPNYIWDAGYLYSYLISISLILFSRTLKGNNYLEGLLKVSILSFIVSLPITLYYYSQINLLSILWNLFFVPFISFIIFPFSFVVLFLKPLLPIYHFLTNLLEIISINFSKISLGKLIFRHLPLPIYFVYFLPMILYYFKKQKRYIYLFLMILLLHFSLPIFNTKDYIKVLDVGQGDSLLIRLKRKTILLDTGGVHSYKEKEGTVFYTILQPTMKKEGIRKINYLILSHGDYDHMGEAINLVNNFKVEKVILNCGPYNDLEKELIRVLDKKNIPYYSCIKELNVDKNKLYFLQTKEYDNENDNSNVIYTELNGYKFMFMGDASSTTEKEILNKYNLPDIDVLKVGHHGSKTSSSNEFINKVSPKYSIISVGKNNRYGHPNKEALDNLDNSKIYRTDIDGSIMVKIKNNKLKIETCAP